MAFLSSPTERRLQPRQAASSRGVLVGPGLEMACLIVDLSDGGFRLRLDRPLSLPRHVILVDIAAGTACESDVVWSRGQEAGLRCGSRPNGLRGLVPQRFAHAREAWLRASGR